MGARSNIAAQFGGDPNTVMIFGQSGGGRKVETLLAMPTAKGLFHRATIESGAALQVASREVAIKNAEPDYSLSWASRKPDVHQRSRPSPSKNHGRLRLYAVVKDERGVDQSPSTDSRPTVDGKIPFPSTPSSPKPRPSPPTYP